MRKVPVDLLEEGMEIAADVFDPGFGGDLPLLGRGVQLTTEYIAKLNDRAIRDILIITPDGYRGGPGEVLAPTVVNADILFDGKVDLACDVPPGIKIQAGESIFIHGDIGKGCSLISAAGEVYVKGSVCGAADSRILISAAQKVTVENAPGKPISYTDIKTTGEIRVSHDVANSTFSSIGKLLVGGKAVRSNLFSQTRIRVHDCGDEATREPCQLLVKPKECRPLFQELLSLDAKILELKKEKSKLENIIDLIRKLGKGVAELPPENREKLAGDVRRFQEVERDSAAAMRRKEEVRQEIIYHLGMQRVFVAGSAFTNIKVTIENNTMILQQIFRGVAFSVENFKIVVNKME